MQSLRPNIYLKLCWRTSPNKRFKADSQRVAFAVCGKFSDLGGVRKHRYCVSHHLSGRYNSFVSFIVTQLSLKPFENGLLVVTAAAAFVRPYRTNN